MLRKWIKNPKQTRTLCAKWPGKKVSTKLVSINDSLNLMSIRIALSLFLSAIWVSKVGPFSYKLVDLLSFFAPVAVPFTGLRGFTKRIRCQGIWPFCWFCSSIPSAQISRSSFFFHYSPEPAPCDNEKEESVSCAPRKWGEEMVLMISRGITRQVIAGLSLRTFCCHAFLTMRPLIQNSD